MNKNYSSMQRYSAGLYLRISQEDEYKQDFKNSVSIETQRSKLLSFTSKNRIPVYDVYCDDGFSGTNFNRPEFKRLIQDIKKQNVNCVIVKDLSRLGREYIKSGDILENFFPSHNVRFIALDDNIDRDPELKDTETHMLLPFYNLLNEFYPADISKKTRSALYAKAEKGEYLSAHVPFGYLRSSSKKNHLEPDVRVYGIVEVIFELIASGWSLSKVARFLHSHKIPNYNDLRLSENTYKWTSQAVRAIIKNETYLGKVIYGKTRRVSYKNSHKIPVDESNWIVNENAHQSLVNDELFHQANEQLKKVKRNISASSTHPFIGKIFCPDCGGPIDFCLEPRLSNENEGYFICRNYKRYGKAECSRHYIRLSKLAQAINKELEYYYKISHTSRRSLYNRVLSEHEQINYQETVELKARLELCLLEERELKEIFISIYRDKALKAITEEEYILLYTEMNQKKYSLKLKIDEYNDRLNDLNIQIQHINTWIDHLISFETPPTVTDENVVANLIDRIEIYDRCEKKQKVRVYYSYVGILRDTIIDL